MLNKWNALDALKKLSATNRIDVMAKNLSNEEYVIYNMALSGQITLFFGRPGCGKTLFILSFLISSIKNGRINPEYLFYINADDNYKGNFDKSKIAKSLNFNMISPGEAGVSSEQIIQLLVQMSNDENAVKVVIVLDTLKKFADMMNKKSQSVFFSAMRKITSKGGTVIIAGHANKNNDAEGNLIYEGTSDTMNDIDCAYSMHKLSESTDQSQIIEFKNEKDRGDVLSKISYRYHKQKGSSYQDMLKSVSPVDESESELINLKSEQIRLKNKFESEILFIVDLLKINGSMKQKEILGSLKDGGDLAAETTNSKLRSALTDKGLEGMYWNNKRGGSNAMNYSLIKESSPTKEMFS